MAYPSKFRAVMATLVLSSLLSMGTANAADNGLYDFQPCPDSLAIAGADQPNKKWDLTLSPYTHHWSQNPEHKQVVLLALDEQLPGNRFCGVSFFSNSFGQPSVYLYAGQQFNGLLGSPKLFVKVTAGILYGYVAPYEDKVPLNHNGFSPAIIPSLGYKISPQDSLQMKILGNAGLMFSWGRLF